ncbi:phosphatase PAP2 family protein [Pararobbsia silviterrae]|uniref:phosphatase PAP2 family protein n=1 Tax=Pararobbsia silviterrae TaxID=1792498 RepID=UPI001F0C610F|nr:phosphatase PAP2 family protein [Pararobbsia silviterrae]
MLPTPLWFTLTGFGGVAVTIPVALAIAAWLAAGMRLRAAVEWLAALALAGALTIATKIAFLGWGVGIRRIDFTGISGHAVLSTLVFPVMFSVVLINAPIVVRRASFLVGLGFGLAIGASRVVVRAHSISEIVAGCALGALFACVFVSRLEARPAPSEPTPHPILVSLSLVALIGALHGVHVPTQRWVTSIALDLSGHERPFIRARWHRDGRATSRLVDDLTAIHARGPTS